MDPEWLHDTFERICGLHQRGIARLTTTICFREDADESCIRGFFSFHISRFAIHVFIVSEVSGVFSLK